jgi:hypothetical protein
MALAPASPEAKSQLACKSTNLEFGKPQSRRGKAFPECFRVDRKGKIIDIEYSLGLARSPSQAQPRGRRSS